LPAAEVCENLTVQVKRFLVSKAYIDADISCIKKEDDLYDIKISIKE